MVIMIMIMMHDNPDSNNNNSDMQWLMQIAGLFSSMIQFKVNNQSFG